MRVCYGQLGSVLRDCSQEPDAEFTAPAARHGQAFALTRSGRREMQLGIAGAPPTDNVASHVELLIEKPAGTVEVTVADAKTTAAQWSFSLPARDLGAVRTIRLPAGAYRMTLRAPQYRDASAVLADGARLVLRRIPAISGRILTAGGEPVPNVVLQPSLAGDSCLSGPDGAFRCEIAAAWPRSLSIAHPGFGTRVLSIDPIERDTDLGEIRLARGARLTVRVDASGKTPEVAIQLFRGDTQVAERRRVPANSLPIEFADLDPGTYRLLVKGARPLEQRASMIEVKPEDNEQLIAIEPSELTLRVYSGSQPESDASIVLKSFQGRWTGAVKTDASGPAVEPLWQLGTFTASVRLPGAATPFLDHRDFSAGEKQRWTLQLPTGRIEGRVISDSGTSISNAEVHLVTDDGDSTTALRTKTDEAGHYVFDRVRAGSQTVSSEAEGYLPSDAQRFRTAESDAARSVDLILRRGQSKRVNIVDARGLSLANAVIFEMVGDRLLNVFSCDATGQADVQLPAAENPVLLAVPPSGSFAVHRVTSVDRDLTSIRIVVPDPIATLDLKTETTDHQPVRGVHFLVRYDGESIPFDVLMQLAQRFGLDFQTGSVGTVKISNLPSGMYELWPYMTVDEARSLMLANELPAPLRMAIVAGDNAATLTFRPKHR